LKIILKGLPILSVAKRDCRTRLKVVGPEFRVRYVPV
jgi:hypothetical protein